ncbi:MAG: serine hydrolase [Candidatus Hermodarchaeota archaeon]|nr:serine hydrolase [Candidatus Hermodarchaeota archaeon]
MKQTRMMLHAAVLIFSILVTSPFMHDRIQAVSPEYWPTIDWQTATPESHDMNVTLLEEMEAYINDSSWSEDIISLLIVHGGYLVYENYFGQPENSDVANEIHSCTKSVTSLLVGIAIAQGHIGGVDEFVLDYFPDRTFENMDSRKEAITIEHLLTMTSGLPWEENEYGALVSSPDWVKWVLDRPMEYAPGETWVYNTGGSHLLSAIVSEAAGQNTTVFADEFLFSPLGITYWWWPGDPQGAAMGGSDLYLRPRDIAKIGYLCLRGGVWDGQIIVPHSWLVTSTSCQYTFHPTLGSAGYGYQWWVYPHVGAYAARGWLGQFIWVVPNHDLVVVITGDSNAIQHHMIVENFIIPSTPSLPPPLNPVIMILPASLGIVIGAVLISVFWKRRR